MFRVVVLSELVAALMGEGMLVDDYCLFAQSQTHKLVEVACD